MKLFSVFVCLAFSAFDSSAQHKIFDLNGDTAFWYNLKQQDVKKIGLTNLTIATDSLHFRFWFINQSIEIWTGNFKTFYGMISNHTEKIASNSPEPDDNKSIKFFSNKIKMDSVTSREVYHIFIESGILDIPTDSKIKGWQMGFDGEELFLEKTTSNFYSFKTFWTPSAQTNVPEADVVENLRQKLQVKLDLKNVWKKFRESLPRGCYRYGEMLFQCNPRSANIKDTTEY